MKNYEDASQYFTNDAWHHDGFRTECIDMIVWIFLAYLDVLNGKENMIFFLRRVQVSQSNTLFIIPLSARLCHLAYS